MKTRNTLQEFANKLVYLDKIGFKFFFLKQKF